MIKPQLTPVLFFINTTITPLSLAPHESHPHDKSTHETQQIISLRADSFSQLEPREIHGCHMET